MQRTLPNSERQEHQRRSLLPHLATACVLLMLLVVSASAWLRLSAARPDCLQWPACRLVAQAPVVLQQAVAAAAPLEQAVRGLHRLAASTVLLIVIVMLWQLTRNRAAPPGQAGQPGLVIALLVCALALSALGIVTPGSQHPAVLLGNLLGGLLMLGLAWSLRGRMVLPVPRAPSAQLRSWARAALCVWLAQAASGALSGAGGGTQGTWAPLLHLAMAAAAVALGIRLVFLLKAAHRLAQAQGLLWLLLAQVLLGLLSWLWGPEPLVVLLHNLCAALGLATLTRLALEPQPAS